MTKKDLENMSEAERMISLLNIDNKKEVMENLKETIKAYKNDMPDADKKLDYLFDQLQFDRLDEDSKNEIYNSFLSAIKSDAGYQLKENYLWNTGTRLAPLRETIVTGSDIVGKDSNLQGDLYKRTKGADNLHRQEPKKRKYDEDEMDIEDKLKLLKKLFNDRNKKKITLTDIKKILQSESIEFRSIIRERLKAASALIEDEPECREQLIEHYFEDGNILNESSGGSSSSMSWNNWQGVSYEVYIDDKNIIGQVFDIRNGYRKY